MVADGDSTDGRPDVFVSYSRSDEVRAREVIAFLQDAGFRVWWDGMLEAGSIYIQSTEDALERARAVVVIWSGRAIGSHWVRDEAQSGRDTRRLVPVSIDGSLPPLGFRQFQSVDLSGWQGAADDPQIIKVRDAVARLVAADSSGAATPAPSPVPLFAPLAVSQPEASQQARKPILLGAVLALVAVLVAAWFMFAGQPSAATPGSIAILPFANLSDDPDQDYFSTGLSQEMRQVLSQGSSLQVAAQTSTMEAATGDADARQIAAALGVDFLLDGSVRRAGDTVRVSVQLIDGETGFELWSDVYERSLVDIFAVQADIASHVAEALEMQLSLDDANIATQQRGTTDPAAYDAYLRGRALYDAAIDEESDRAALRLFQQAVAADPDYGLAWAALARTQTLVASSYPGERPLAEAYGEAVASARRGVEAAPEIADTHAALGFVLFNGRLDAVAAEGPFNEAYRLGRGDADILQAYATFAARIGDFDAARIAIARSVELDPLNPLVKRSEAMILYAAGDYAAAAEAATATLALNPDMRVTHRLLGDIAYLAGDYRTARAEYELEGSPLSRLPGLAMVLPRTGDMAGGQAALAQLRAQFGLNGLYQEAQVLAQTGDASGAITALERAYGANDAGLVLLRNDPLFAPLRDEPRFAALLQRMGFTLPD